MSELRLGRLHLRLGRFARVIVVAAAVVVVFFSVSTIFKLSFPVQAEKGDEDEDEDAEGCGCGVEDAANDGDDSVVIHRQSFLLPVFVS